MRLSATQIGEEHLVHLRSEEIDGAACPHVLLLLGRFCLVVSAGYARLASDMALLSRIGESR